MQNFISLGEVLGFKKQPTGFATKSIHAGQNPEQWNCRAIIPPIVTSKIYQYVSLDKTAGYGYSRHNNPTRDVLDKCIASIDNAEYALSFSAGVGVLTAILATLKTGDGIVSTHDLYGGSLRLLRDYALKMGIVTEYIDFEDFNSLENALKPNTKLVWLESPTNPLMTVVDIKAIADIVHSKSKAIFVVDNTFLTPYFQRPLELGADAVMYSLSKFMNGHSDLIMGAVTTNNKEFYETLKYFQTSIGVVPSARDCYEVNRSLKTLPLRMEQHFRNSYEIAQFLEAHPKVEKVYHPALKSHKNHEIALKQSYGNSGIMSFKIKGSLEQSRKFFSSLKLIMIAESLGGVESSVAFPWTMSHSDICEVKRIEVGVTNTLIRFSVGLEDVTELIFDLDQALMSVN